MTIIQALILGIVQGLTEFLPVSSSGHLVLFQALLGLEMPGLTFEVFVHFGTLLAIFIAFWPDIIDIIQGIFRYVRGPKKRFQDIHLPFIIVIGSIPAGFVGIRYGSMVASLYQGIHVVGWSLLVTGTLLWISSKISSHRGKVLDEISTTDSFIIGIGQALALAPGISRSGSTIAFGLFRGLDRETAARYSFLLVIPAISGATLLELLELRNVGEQIGLAPLLVGTLSAAISGYLAIRILLRIIREGRLIVFSYYTWSVGIAVIIWSIMR